MFVAEATVFFIFDPAGLLSLVLRGRIVTMFADCAFKCNYLSHNLTSVWLHIRKTSHYGHLAPEYSSMKCSFTTPNVLACAPRCFCTQA